MTTGGNRPSLASVLREWGRIGCIGFGGPPTHIKLLRDLCVDNRNWLTASEFEDAVATCNLLPGPASTQLAIFSAWRVRGIAGAIVGGTAFIAPGLILILALSTVFLEQSPPRAILAAGAGAGSALAAVAVHSAAALVPDSWRRADVPNTGRRLRWSAYLLAGALAAALIGPWLVLVLLACGAIEVAARARPAGIGPLSISPAPFLLGTLAVGTLPALVWTSLKVGALSYGGGFVIIPMMQNDAVNEHRWMSGPQFLNAVSLGQITPGPVTHTVAVVGYAAGGLVGGLVAALLAFGPSFAFVLLGGRHFDRLRSNSSVRQFLDGAGPAAIGAIGGSAITLALVLTQPWQFVVLAAAALALLVLKRAVVPTLLGATICGVALVACGLPLPH